MFSEGPNKLVQPLFIFLFAVAFAAQVPLSIVTVQHLTPF